MKLLFLYFLAISLVDCDEMSRIFNWKNGSCLDDSQMEDSGIAAKRSFHGKLRSFSDCIVKCLNLGCLMLSYSNQTCIISTSLEVSLINGDCLYWIKGEDLDLIAFWKFSNYSRGINYADRNKHEAIVVGTPLFSYNHVRSTANYNGFNVSSIVSEGPFDKISISAWWRPIDGSNLCVFFEFIKPGSLPATRVWMWDTSTSLQWHTEYLNATAYFKFVTSQTGYVPLNAWTHVAMSANKTHSDIWINGTLLTGSALKFHDDIVRSDVIDVGNQAYLGYTTNMRTDPTYLEHFTGDFKCVSVSKGYFTDLAVRDVITLCS